MFFLEILKTILFGIIQGITEWLPVSSTGHLILVNQFINLNVGSANPDAFKRMFDVVIQLGSILAVLLLYFDKLNPLSPKKKAKEKKETWLLWVKVVIASIPAAIIGFLLDDVIDEMLKNWEAYIVAVALIVYGVLFIVLENNKRKPKINELKELDYKTAFGIGVFQVLALIPGTSRSGSTILGATFLGASRHIAAEFSFFLAIPVMFGASGLKFLKYGIETGFAFSGAEISVLLIGMIVSFVVSLFAIKFLMGYIKKHDFKGFGYYRIVLGVLVLLYFTIFR